MNGDVKRGFKPKTIEKTIRHKINHWISTLKVEDENEDKAKLETSKLQAEVRESYIVTGGAITSMLLGELPNDYDIYFNNTDTAKKVVDHYLKRLVKADRIREIKSVVDDGRVKIMIKSAGVVGEDTDTSKYDFFESLSVEDLRKYFEDDFQKDNAEKGKYKVINANTNAITLSDDIQLIIRFVGPPEEIHKNYDFVHCTNWYTEKDGLVLNQAALTSILTKELKYVGSKYPLCSMFRLKKFIQRGWTITAGEMLKIGWDINDLNLKGVTDGDYSVLQDQLIGVDAAYFYQLLSALKEQTREGRPIDRTYLFEVINRVFDEDEDFERMSAMENESDDYENYSL